MADPDLITSSIWADTAKEHFAGAPLPGPLDCRVAVIGGGLLGLNAALGLAQRGVSVVVLEGAGIGDGASGRNGGLVVPALPRLGPGDAIRQLGPEYGPRMVREVGGAAQAVFDLIRTHAIDCDPVQRGWVQPAHAAMMAPGLEKRVAEWGQHGAQLQYLDAAETRRRIGSQAFHGALFAPTGGHLNSYAYTHGLARVAQAAGARIFTGTPVSSIQRNRDRWDVLTPQGRVTADVVLQCTNAHPPGLPGPLATSWTPLTVYQLATEPVPAHLREQILPGDEAMADTRNALFAACYDVTGRLVHGGMAVVQQGAVDRLPRLLARRFGRIFPQLAPVRFTRIWRGRAALTGDFLPRLFQMGPGWYAPIGCNGRGIAMTTVLGARLAEYIATGNADVLPLPMTEPAPIPLHAVRQYWPQALLPLGILQDALREKKK